MKVRVPFHKTSRSAAVPVSAGRLAVGGRPKSPRGAVDPRGLFGYWLEGGCEALGQAPLAVRAPRSLWYDPSSKLLIEQ